ncbi:cytochrome P450 [Amanita rubescens]|nr:cytochrome P450 [Amanita rubescens]
MSFLHVIFGASSDSSDPPANLVWARRTFLSVLACRFLERRIFLFCKFSQTIYSISCIYTGPLHPIFLIMAWITTAETFVSLALTLAAIVVVKRLGSRSKLPLPPGPPAHWLWGSKIPKEYVFIKFEELSKQYGPIFTLKQGLETIIVVGGVKAGVDILEKDGSHTLDRPLIAAGETLSGATAPLLQGRGKQLIQDILEDPDNHFLHAQRYAASVVMLLAYNKIPEPNDPDIKVVNECLERLGIHMRPGYWKSDYWPILKYIPGYLKELQIGHELELGLYKKQLYEVKDKMARGEDVGNCLSKNLLESQQVMGLSDSEAAYLAGSMFGAGSETTASAITITILAAACYPEAQRWVQEELDEVLGGERPPRLADMDILPRTHAFVLENFRWRPATPGAVPHKATEDIIWQNYRIPKGATIIGNVWGMGRDPEFFPDGDKFDPRRWLDDKGKIREDLKIFPFGFGRRCGSVLHPECVC